MPCRDGSEFSGYEESRKQRDALQQKLCQMGKLVFALRNHIDTRNLAPHENATLLWALREHKQHREEDKKRTLSDLRSKLTSAADKVTSIRNLGGEPGAALLEQIRTLQRDIVAVEASDPESETSLY